MTLYDSLDDEDLIEQLLAAGRYLENDAAHQGAQVDYIRIGRLADVCRQAATRIDQLLLMLKANGAK